MYVLVIKIIQVDWLDKVKLWFLSARAKGLKAFNIFILLNVMCAPTRSGETRVGLACEEHSGIDQYKII